MFYLKNIFIYLLFFLVASPLISFSSSEEILKNLSLEEKIGQLLMVGLFPEKNSQEEIIELIENYHIGGILFFKGFADTQIDWINTFQNKSKLPLLIGQDNEWGLSLRLQNTLRFPRNLTLGAIQNNELLYEFGREIGKQCRQVGVFINFAPVVDINSNPFNPVISDRSFGENKFIVAEKSLAVMHGLQDERVLACAKHWPGHGDTDQDSHKQLPSIHKSLDELKECELYPFYKLIDGGVKSIMVAHLNFPFLDPSGMPSSLSPNVIHKLLQEDSHFQGLVITDSLQMQAIQNQHSTKAEVLAIQAGNDILLYPSDIPKTVEAIKHAIINGEISESQINASVLKILKAKKWTTLFDNRYVEPNPKLITKKAAKLKKKLYEQAVTLVKNNHEILPLENSLHMAYIQIGGKISTAISIEGEITTNSDSTELSFYKTLDSSNLINYFYIDKNAPSKEWEELYFKFVDYDVVLISIFDMNKWNQQNFGLTTKSINFIESIKEEDPFVILTIFGNPYSLKNFSRPDAILVAYENDPDAQISAAEIIQGYLNPKGKLPVTASPDYPEGFGLSY